MLWWIAFQNNENNVHNNQARSFYLTRDPFPWTKYYSEIEANTGYEHNNQDAIYPLCTPSQNQTQLITLTDHKTNILLGNLVVMLTILFSWTDFQIYSDGVFRFSVYTILIMESMTAFLAILIIIPKNAHLSNAEELENDSNILFFGVFTKFKEEEYIPFSQKGCVINNTSENWWYAISIKRGWFYWKSMPCNDTPVSLPFWVLSSPPWYQPLPWYWSKSRRNCIFTSYYISFG